VKLDSHEPSPPPLYHSPRESTAASTPITTPVEQPASPHFGRLPAWHRKPHEPLPDTELLFEDAGDCGYPLFSERPQPPTMTQTAVPIDIQPPSRYGSHSPQNQPSNLTLGLRDAEASRGLGTTPNQLNPHGYEQQRPAMGERHPSASLLGSSIYGTGARPISMKDRPRRESNQMGSFAGGMSWGGVSMGSWIRDE
jgi:transcription factor SFP1